MLQNYILLDILQYVFNSYLDWRKDIPKLSNICNSASYNNFDFDIKHHTKTKDEFQKGLLYQRYIYVDDIISKIEQYFISPKYNNLIGKKICENIYIYIDEKLDEKIMYYYYDMENIIIDQIDKTFFIPKLKKVLYDINNKLDRIENYTNIRLGDIHSLPSKSETYEYWPNGNLKLKSEYILSTKDGQRKNNYFTEDEILYKTEIFNMKHLSLILDLRKKRI
jgi:hypothetical protein